MPNTIKVKRGLEANRTSVTPAEGEFLYATDQKKVYIGDGTTAGGVAVGAGADVQIFTSSGTWTKPSGAQTVTVICIAGGGGGASGSKGAAGTNRLGGGGGGGGGYSVIQFKASDLPASVSVTIGAGGTAGAAVTTNSTNGNNGGAGGNTTFGSYVAARGGGGGPGGFDPAGGLAGRGLLSGIGNPGGGGQGNVPLAASTGNNPAGAGGGGGGNIDAANTVRNGGQGWNTARTTSPRWINPDSNDPSSLSVTGAGSSGTDLTSAYWYPGESGDGGAASGSGNAFAGGNGGKWGGGGGGGGAAANSVGNSGAGGTGGSGLCVVITE